MAIGEDMKIIYRLRRIAVEAITFINGGINYQVGNYKSKYLVCYWIILPRRFMVCNIIIIIILSFKFMQASKQTNFFLKHCLYYIIQYLFFVSSNSQNYYSRVHTYS